MGVEKIDLRVMEILALTVGPVDVTKICEGKPYVIHRSHGEPHTHICELFQLGPARRTR